MSLREKTVAVFGASGAVGLELLKLLAARGIDPSRVVACASERSVGKHVPYGAGSLELQSLPQVPIQVDGVFLAVGQAHSRALVQAVSEAPTWIVDLSSAFRQDPDVPLVVPEVNGALLSASMPLVANPNCSTILLTTTLQPVRERHGLQSIVVSTYQAVSGAGAAAMSELSAQSDAVLRGQESESAVFKEPCAFNVFSHDSAVDEATGHNGEEAKIVAETRRLFGDSTLDVVATCIRVPVYRAHSEAVVFTTREPTTVDAVRAALASSPAIRLVDDRAGGVFPTPAKAAHGDEILVGRVRALEEPEGSAAGVAAGTRFGLWLCGDQLRKGAALNAVQIAEALTG